LPPLKSVANKIILGQEKYWEGVELVPPAPPPPPPLAGGGGKKKKKKEFFWGE